MTVKQLREYLAQYNIPDSHRIAVQVADGEPAFITDAVCFNDGSDIVFLCTEEVPLPNFEDIFSAKQSEPKQEVTNKIEEILSGISDSERVKIFSSMKEMWPDILTKNEQEN